jgi:hypothetical protein
MLLLLQHATKLQVVACDTSCSHYARVYDQAKRSTPCWVVNLTLQLHQGVLVETHPEQTRTRGACKGSILSRSVAMQTLHCSSLHRAQ